jgi:hypothetical protein
VVRGLVAQGADWTRGTDTEVRTALERELDRLGRADPFEILGVEYGADEDAIRAAFLQATKVLHPNRFARRERAVTRVANEVYLRVKDAYYAIAEEQDRTALLAKLGKGTSPGRDAGKDRARPVRAAGTDGDKPAAPRRNRFRRRRPAARAVTTPDEIAKQVMARDLASDDEIEAAKALLDAGKPGDARQAFHKLAAAHSKDRRLRQWLHLAMGREHEAAGDVDRARAEYRRALDVDGEFAPARAAMDELPAAEPAAKKGLFSRLFRK